MRKILVLFFFIVAMFAYDKNQLLQMVKQNPTLLDTPQGQMFLQSNGLTKEQVLMMLQGNNAQYQEINGSLIQNNIQLSEVNFSNMEKNETNETNETNNSLIQFSPLKFQSEKEIIEAILEKQQRETKTSLKRYGEKFFYNKNKLNREILAVPDYYQVNKGDVVNIQIFGGNDKTIQTTVDNYGNITLPVVGPINVAGITVAELKNLIIKKLKPTYPNSTIVVNLKVNSYIQVSLTGFVEAPGVYNLSSLSTVKDLLIAANGFGKLGSMRNVYLKRGGKILKIIDFYKLIKNGEVVDTTLLRNGDVIYVPRAKKLVALIGEVNIPAIYELKDNEKLKDLIQYAGGLKADASKKEIKITHFLKNSYTKVVLRDINTDEKLLNGDDIYVYKISELNKDFVYVYGNIEKPGSFELPKDKKLATLLKKLNYLKDTYKGYGLIERFNGKIISFSLLNPKGVKLKSKDKIFIFNKYQVLPNFYVKVMGDVVKTPGELRYFAGMTLKDAINNAGIKVPFDKTRVQIVRYNENLEPTLKFVNYNLNKNMPLKPFDEITLYKWTDFNPLKAVSVYGEVNKPDVYVYSKGLTLKEVIQMAGGFTQKADKSYIELIRYKIANGKRERIIKKIDYFENRDLQILPYDEINVKMIPNWYERMTVTIGGAVKYPGVYVIKKGEKLASVIKRAGGFTEDAYLYGAVFTRESVRKMQEKELKEMIYKLKKKVAIISASAKGAGEQAMNATDLINAIDNLAVQAEKLKPIGRVAIVLDRNLTKFEKSPYNISLETNDSLYIPIKPNTITVLGEVLTPSAFVYTDKSALKYIQKAGGRTNLADNVFFVVHANGFTEKGEFGSWFDKDLDIKPGDAVTVPINIKTSTWYGIAKDITSIVYQLAITAASLKTVGAL